MRNKKDLGSLLVTQDGDKGVGVEPQVQMNS